MLLNAGYLPASASALQFYYLVAFAAGVLLALRARSSRVWFGLLVLFLAHYAVQAFTPGHGPMTREAHIALALTAVLVPVNFVLLALSRDHGLMFSASSSGLATLFLQSSLVVVAARSGSKDIQSMLQYAFLPPGLFGWTRLPHIVLLAFSIAFVGLLIRFLLDHKPLYSGLFWALASALLAWQTGAVGRVSEAYLGTGALILGSAVIESFYAMAYLDELTALPSRRAFNSTLSQLKDSYSIAMVDIDRFKNFNDTYGHEAGDEVLRMVAGKIARVGGGGAAFRIGGEEFAIVFAGKKAKDAEPHLEALRSAVENSEFRVRGGMERRTVPRGPDRRRVKEPGRKNAPAARKALQVENGLRVTVSIGVANTGSRTTHPDQVSRAADKALYRAKREGRNRVASASAVRARAADANKRSIA